MGQVDGKVAVVTGAASGIGAATARVLAREGARVVITDLDDTAGQAIASEIGGHYIHHDVTDEEGWKAVIADTGQRFGRLDIVVANAGIGIMGPAVDMSLTDWRRQMAVNVDGVFLGVKTALPLMRKGKAGSIVNISSIAGLRGAANLSAYCTSKGAVRLFTKSVAIECAAMQDGIRCNSVHPGLIETPIWRQVVPGSNEPMDLDAAAALRVPMRRKGWPEDIAKVVLFLASEDSGYMTGEEVVVDGGMTVGSV